MAKDKKKGDSPTTTIDAPRSSAVVPTAGPPERLAGKGSARPATTDGHRAHDVADAAVSAASDVVQVIRGVLPNRAPAYLGGAALLVFGVVDPPAALGGALVYEALRRWSPSPVR